MSDPHVLNEFLRRYLDDQAAGTAWPVEHYQALFPGHDALIADQVARYRDAEAETQAEAVEASGRIGPFEIIREIGRGGQGTVYLAQDPRLGRPVAVKVLAGMQALTSVAVARLMREAKIAASLQHPGICGVLEASLGTSVPYIAMPYVEGRTLSQKIAETRDVLSSPPSAGAFDLDEPEAATEGTETATRSRVLDREGILGAVRIIEKAARALHAAHEAGIVHRDVKPGNIMITPTNEPVILDFGFAHQDESDLPTLTRSGDLMGTPAYMSPEQLARKALRLDRRTDVWSLGVCLYEILTLRRPFGGPTREALCQAILTDDPPAPRRINRAIPNDLKAVLDMVLEKNRDRRYQTAEAFADDLHAILEGRPVAAKAIGPAGRFARWACREPAKAALLLAALVGVSAASILTTLRVLEQPQRETQRLAEIQSMKEAHVIQGYYELEGGSGRKAIAAFEAALALEGGSPEAALGIALAHESRQRPADALGALDAYADMLGGRRAAAALRAKVESRPAGDPAALPPLRDALDWYLEGQRMIAEGHDGREEAFSQAQDAFTRAILLSPTAKLAFHVEAVHAASHAGDLDALRRLEVALRTRWPEAKTAHFWRGNALSDLRDWENAIAAYRRAIELEAPDVPDPAHHHNLAMALLEAGRPAEAIAEARIAITAKPDHAVAHLTLANGLHATGATDEAIAAYRRSIELQPNRARASRSHSNLAVVLAKENRLDEAIVEYERALVLLPDAPRAHYGLGQLLARRGLEERAVDHLRIALRALPREPGPLCELARVLGRWRRHDEAIDLLQRALDISPDHAWIHGELAQYLGETGRLDEAIEACRAALRVDEKLARAWCKLGGLLRMKRRFKEAFDANLRGHELGFGTPDWNPLSEQWVDECRQLAENERRLQAIVASGATPEPEDLSDCAALALAAGNAATAARWYLEASARAPAIMGAPGDGHRLMAACAAALVSLEPGLESRPALDTESAAWRGRALAWMRADLDAWHAITRSSPEVVFALIGLRDWLAAPALESLRNPRKRSVLPSVERDAWAGAFADAAVLLEALR